MTFLNWLEINYSSLQSLAKTIDNENGLEVLHFTIDKFLTRRDLTFFDALEDNDKLKYMSKTLKLQARSDTSQFFREWKKYTILSKDVILEMEDVEYEVDYEQEMKLIFIEEQLKQMNWFSSLLFKRYIDTGYSAKYLASELLIPLSTVQYHLRKVRTEIKNNWNKNKNKYGL